MSNTTQALSRIEAILDDSSFVEIGAAVTARATDFNMQEKKAPSDGVITGYGVINGNLVYVYSQDAAVLGGTIGEMHAKKIANLYEKAMKMGAPVIGLIDCAGLRLQEATDALDGFGQIYKNMSFASGIVPPHSPYTVNVVEVLLFLQNFQISYLWKKRRLSYLLTVLTH